MYNKTISSIVCIFDFKNVFLISDFSCLFIPRNGSSSATNVVLVDLVGVGVVVVVIRFAIC